MRFFLFSLFFYTTYSLGCEVEYIKSIPIYSGSCSINTTKNKQLDSLLLQFKFTNINQTNIIAELKKLKNELSYDVAAQRINNGYRLFIGPVNQQQILHARRLLLQIGYRETLLKSIPKIELSSKKNNFSYQLLGNIDSTIFYIPINSSMRPMRSSYNQASQACTALGSNTRIAKGNEYLKILLSDDNKLLLSDIAVPFWFSSKSVVTRVERNIYERPSSDLINYKVICALLK